MENFFIVSVLSQSGDATPEGTRRRRSPQERMSHKDHSTKTIFSVARMGQSPFFFLFSLVRYYKKGSGETGMNGSSQPDNENREGTRVPLLRASLQARQGNESSAFFCQINRWGRRRSWQWKNDGTLPLYPDTMICMGNP